MIEFGDLRELAMHLTDETVGGLVNAKKGVKAAVEMLDKAAKAEFGIYQEASGPFAAWAELADSTKEDRLAKGFSENDPLLRSGELRDSIHHEAEDWEGIVGSTSEIMLYQELGTSRIPPRPVLGIALYDNLDRIREMIGHAAVSGFVGGQRMAPSLGYDV